MILNDVYTFERRLSLKMGFLTAIVVCGFMLILVCMYERHITPRKSWQYRKLLTDLYVAGKIRKFAEVDGIKFSDEEANFSKWTKKQRLIDLSLDGSVEEELQERISKVRLEEAKKPKHN